MFIEILPLKKPHEQNISVDIFKILFIYLLQKTTFRKREGIMS